MISGSVEGGLGRLWEITKSGRETVVLTRGTERHFLKNGNMVHISAIVECIDAGFGFREKMKCI